MATISEIKLGYMNIAGGKWEPGFEDGDDDDNVVESNLDPEEIIVPHQDITVVYDYPLEREFEFTHHTDNPNGFTRIELCQVVMDQYKKIYEEEEEEDGDPGYIPGMLNRAKSNGKYGIWGHDIGDLILHTLYICDDDKYALGIDS